jgi:predicted phage-related endonuclease
MERIEKQITSEKTREILEDYIKLYSKIKEMKAKLENAKSVVLSLFNSPKYEDCFFVVGDKRVVKTSACVQNRVDSKKLQEFYPEIYEQTIKEVEVKESIRIENNKGE